MTQKRQLTLHNLLALNVVVLRFSWTLVDLISSIYDDLDLIAHVLF